MLYRKVGWFENQQSNNKSRTLRVNRSIHTEHSPQQPFKTKNFADNQSPHTRKIKRNLSDQFNQASFSINDNQPNPAQGIKRIYPQYIKPNRQKYADVIFTGQSKRDRTNKVRDVLSSR